MTDTPLALKLKARIHRDGPLSVAEYMSACLHDPEYGYYRSQPAIGASGDFVTAPEISQVFGELIGLWCAVVWQQMGSPARLNLVELGPGRGTQMRDALRAVKIVPGFREALSIHLVESNATLVPLQRTALASQGVEAVWHASPDACADALAGQSAPFVIIANEFLDTCPVDQYEAQGGQFVMRGVGLDEAGALAFTLLPNRAQPVATSQGLREGQQIEIADFSFFDPIAKLMAEKPSAALFIDYGAAVASTGDTLQAVRNHRSEPPLQSPGEADLSFQVDFAGFRSVVLETPGLAVDGPVPQAQFLGRLGIVERASRLMSANPDRAAAIEASVARLIAPSGMGSRFLALGVRSEGVAPLPGFSG